MGTTTTKESMDVNLVMKKTSCSDAGDVETGNKIANNESKSASLNANDKSDSTQADDKIDPDATRPSVVGRISSSKELEEYLEVMDRLQKVNFFRADDKIDPDATRPSVVGRISSYLPRKSEVDKAVSEIQWIKFGKYIIAWRVLPFRMGAALFVEFAIGFLAILTAKGDFQVLPTSVSILYLFYLFSSSKSQNTVRLLNIYNEELKWLTRRRHSYIYGDESTPNEDESTGLLSKGCEVLLMVISTPIILVISVIFKVIVNSLSLAICVILDLVNIRFESDNFGAPNLSFAAADLITIIASINYASRATDLSVAVPLLVSFDFLTKFSTQILDSIEVSDDECKEAAVSWWLRISTGHPATVECFLNCVLLLAVGIVITGVVLAILSIGIN